MTKAREITRVIDALLAERPAMVAAYGLDSCIICTRIAVEIARGQGLRIEPLAVAVRLSKQGLPAGSLGFTSRPLTTGDWDGHVVAVIEGRHALDLTLDSARMGGFDVVPVTFEVAPEFRRGDGEATIQVGGTEVRYQARPDEKEYLSLEDWSDVDERNRVLPSSAAGSRPRETAVGPVDVYLNFPQ